MFTRGEGISLPRADRTVSTEPSDKAASPACPAIDHTHEYLKLIVAALVFAAAEARLLGRAETLRLTAAALASARRDLALYKANGDERAR